MFLQGTIQYHGQPETPPHPDWTYVNYTLNQSTWYFPPNPNSPAISQLLRLLNQYCPCGQHWVEGEYIVVYADDCPSSTPPQFEFCDLLRGGIQYQIYKFCPGPFSVNGGCGGFIGNVASLDPGIGWDKGSDGTNGPNDPDSRPDEKLEQSGALLPVDCADGMSVWTYCEPVLNAGGMGFSGVAPECDGCQNPLECTGCAWRYYEAIAAR
jgi:hypothetical protein